MKTDPPQSPSPAKSIRIDRRRLISASILGAAASATPLSAQIGRGPGGFTHGVASGEPSQNSVLLWTRFESDLFKGVDWVISENADLSKPAMGGYAPTRPDRDYCIKVDALGNLKPGTWYYYQFIAPDGTKSPVGRTRTLPEGPTASWKMAVFSCSNLGFGWFNAYAHAAKTNEFDCTLHLGDYIYEYPLGSYPSERQIVAGRTLDPLSETVSLADYRLRYAAYRSDPDLQRIHQLYPMISGWDDHESTNDSWKGGAQNHQPETEGSWDVRKAAAMQVYREWMPVSDAPWASYEIGDLATLYRLETRLLARDEAPDFAKALRAGSPEQVMAALRAFKAEEWRDPSRQMLGAEQEAWLFGGLKQSRASGKPWQVLAQQTLMMSLSTAPSVAEGLTDAQPEWLRNRIRASAAAGAAGLPFNMDAWDGYPAARERVLKAALEADANLISLAGDTHNAWAGSLDHAGELAGVEFGGHSVTSPGAENSLSWIKPADLARDSIERNPQLAWANTSSRGYMAVTLTPSIATSEWRFLDTVRQRSTRIAGTHLVQASAGEKRLLPA